ncbi:MAG: hypothetical protein OHK0017_09130 [Patescibacteria group bacterium]
MPQKHSQHLYHANYHYDKYEYIDKKPGLVRLKYSMAVLTWTLVVYGFWRFLNLNNWYWLVFGPFWQLPHIVICSHISY